MELCSNSESTHDVEFTALLVEPDWLIVAVSQSMDGSICYMTLAHHESWQGPHSDPNEVQSDTRELIQKAMHKFSQSYETEQNDELDDVLSISVKCDFEPDNVVEVWRLKLDTRIRASFQRA
jgi:hypothetical protein